MAPRIVAWGLLGVLVIVLLVATTTKTMSSAPATGVRTVAGSDIGRYQVVRQTPDQIILLDTTSGEMYKAGPDDILPYAKIKEEETEDSMEEPEEE